jgi:hypothetical protein
MIKPVTLDEKLLFTLKFQFEKLVDELLGDLVEEKYTGLVEIWPIYSYSKNKELKLEIKYEKIVNVAAKKKSELSLRYHVAGEKGVKLIV